jgi:hypothetical protein
LESSHCIPGPVCGPDVKAGSRKVVEVKYLQKAWALARRTGPKSAQNTDVQASLDVQPDPEDTSSKVTDHNALRPALEVPRSPSSPAYTRDEAAGTGPKDGVPPEGSEHPIDLNASVEVLAKQILSLADVVSTQGRDIKALKAHCQQFEDHERAIMVAFKTFFHVLAAGKVAKLEDVSAILQNIISVAQHETYPPESIRFLRSLATMLHPQPGTGAAELQTHDPAQ